MSNYWKKRNAQSIQKLTDKNIAEVEAQIAEYYKDTQARVIGDFIRTYEKLLSDTKRLGAPTPADLYKLDKYWKLQAQAKKHLEHLNDKSVELLDRSFTKQFKDVYRIVSKLYNAGEYANLQEANVKQMINSIWCADGKSWSSRVWNNTALLQEELNKQLIHTVVTGDSPIKLKKLLAQEFNVSYHRAKTLVNTEMAHIETQAAQERYKDYGIQEVEIIVEAEACDDCKELEGKTFSIHEQMPVPMHPNCRCCVVPVIKFKKEGQE